MPHKRIKRIGSLLGMAAVIAITAITASSSGIVSTKGATAQAAERPALSDNVQAKPGEGLTEMAERGDFKLYFDNDTGGFAVEDTVSGVFYRSSPENAANDTKATDSVKQDIMSPVKITYYNNAKRAEGEMASYKEALLLNQVYYCKIENGFRMSMHIGRAEQRVLLPKQILVEDMTEDIINNLDTERKQRQVLAFYILYTTEGLDDTEAANLIAQYPALEYGDIYVLKTGSSERDIKLLEGYILETGYTYEMLAEDYETIGFVDEDSIFPSFGMSIDYILNDDGSLTVELDAGKIEYDTTYFLLTKISLLNFFGAGETGEEGYIFLPDGSGTIVNFNNDGSKTSLLTSGRLYGPDYAINQTRRGSFKQEYRMPVFGIKKDDEALFGIVENGDATAELMCELGNIIHSYNTAYMLFYIRSKDMYMPPGAFELEPWVIYEKEGYTGLITMRYYFLRGDDASYAGMAKAYRNYLVDKDVLSPIEDAALPFYLDSIAAVKIDKRVLGLPMYVPVAVTSTENAEDMIKELTEQGVGNITMRLKAWFGNTYYNSAAAKFGVNGDIGGKKGLSNLSKNVEQYGAVIAPDIDFLYGSSDKNFDGFSFSHDTAKTLYQKVASKSELNVATLTFMSNQYVVAPSVLDKFFTNFMKGYDKLNLSGVSLGSLGEGLSSDFKNKSYVNRQDSLEISVSLLERAAAEYGSVIVNAGNAYSLKYAGAVLNMADSDSSYAISDETVPFMQTVLHGYINYAGEPINLSSDWRQSMLKSIEYAQAPYFALNYEDGKLLKEAFIYDEIYSMKYDDWKDTAVYVYKTVNDALKDVLNTPIADHVNISKGVAMTIYENGVKILVNYNKEPVNAEGITIEAESFVVINN